MLVIQLKLIKLITLCTKIKKMYKNAKERYKLFNDINYNNENV